MKIITKINKIKINNKMNSNKCKQKIRNKSMMVKQNCFKCQIYFCNNKEK